MSAADRFSAILRNMDAEDREPGIRDLIDEITHDLVDEIPSDRARARSLVEALGDLLGPDLRHAPGPERIAQHLLLAIHIARDTPYVARILRLLEAHRRRLTPVESLARLVQAANTLGADCSAALLAALRTAQAATPEVLPRLMTAIVIRWSHWIEGAVRGSVIDGDGVPRDHVPLCPAYPRTLLWTQACVVLGRAPHEILRGLTRAEAHAALATGHTGSAAAWIYCGVASLRVARWRRAVDTDPRRQPALSHQWTQIVHGRLRTIVAYEIVDIVRGSDLAVGAKTGVRSAIDAAAHREYARWARKHAHDWTQLAAPPSWWRPVPGIELLDTSAALIREGMELRHCVGTYAPRVEAGESVIVSITATTDAGQIVRSTAELDSAGSFVAHLGPANAEPCAACQHALRNACTIWRGERE